MYKDVLVEFYTTLALFIHVVFHLMRWCTSADLHLNFPTQGIVQRFSSLLHSHLLDQILQSEIDAGEGFFWTTFSRYLGRNVYLNEIQLSKFLDVRDPNPLHCSL